MNLNVPLEFEPERWREIWSELLSVHGPRIAHRAICKRELGFTHRLHKYLPPDQEWYDEKICLDFYDEASRTMFMLKYL
jgi:hypothetical protein